MAWYVVTGASSGIGEACAVRLAAAGHGVVATVRANGDGRRLAARSDRIIPAQVDVTDESKIADLAVRVGNCAPAGLAGLVNNAGIAVGGPLEFLPLDEWRTQLEVNLIGQIGVTKALIPHLRRARGRVVFVGSIAGRVSTPLLGPYAASKHALRAVADALREELRPWDMPVSLIEPGAVRTPIWAKARAYADDLDARTPSEGLRLYAGQIAHLRSVIDTQERVGIPAERVAAVVERALVARWPRYRVPVGRESVATSLLARALPDRTMALVTRHFGP